MIRPFIAEENPGLNLEIDKTRPLFATAVKDLEDMLAKHDVNFTPNVYRYLNPNVTDSEMQQPRNSTSEFRIQNTWCLEPASSSSAAPATPIPDLKKTCQIMADSNKALFGPQLNFKKSDGLEALMKEREARKKYWEEFELQKAIGQGLQTTKKVMMLDTDFIVNEEKAKFEAKKKQEEDAAAEAARKRKDVEEKKYAVQHAKELKERELNERKLQKERAVEERKQREIDEKQKREEERIKREETRRLREEEDRLREERRKIPLPPIPEITPDLPAPVAPPAPVVPPVHQGPTAESVLGADIVNVSEEDVALVQQFLSGRYDKTNTTKEIKLSEATVTDAVSGITQAHTLYLVLDYEQCKWRKVKRKRRV
ncbi:hypothetical protein HDU98_005949 [Podochytrium sp. JEL0797]|nr:hypothetical protein HDU98_005949 [Podochytrium sp. JEL0797]